MKLVLKILANAVWILLILTIIFPIGWFAWRMGRPMDMPEYNGLTYYQFLSWRKDAYHELAADYLAAHPDKRINFGLNQCFYVVTSVDTFGRFPTSSLYALASIYPDKFLRFIALDERDQVPENGTWKAFLPTWWNGFEYLLWTGVDAGAHDLVPYCRLPPDIPTPAQMKTLQNQYRQTANP